MWMGIRPLSKQQLTDFEKKFNFNVTPVFRTFLLEHNAGIPNSAIFPTTVKERRLVRLLDFADRQAPTGAWAINQRLRNEIGEKRIIIGMDSLDNFVCLERYYRRQSIVLWNHLTGGFEESLLDISAFLRVIG